MKQFLFFHLAVFLFIPSITSFSHYPFGISFHGSHIRNRWVKPNSYNIPKKAKSDMLFDDESLYDNTNSSLFYCGGLYACESNADYLDEDLYNKHSDNFDNNLDHLDHTDSDSDSESDSDPNSEIHRLKQHEKKMKKMVDPDLLPPKTKYVPFSRVNPSPKASIKTALKTNHSVGPWMADEVPDDGLQKWLAYCWISEDRYLERLKKRQEVESLHDAWARRVRLPSQVTQLKEENICQKPPGRPANEKNTPRLLWEKCIISKTLPNPDGMLLCIGAPSYESFENFMLGSPMFQPEFPVFDKIMKFKWDQNNLPELRIMPYERLFMILRLDRMNSELDSEFEDKLTKSADILKENAQIRKNLKSEHLEFLKSCEQVNREGPLRNAHEVATVSSSRTLLTTSRSTGTHGNAVHEEIGSLIIKGCNSVEEAYEWSKLDPYDKAGLYEHTEIRRCMEMDRTGLYSMTPSLESLFGTHPEDEEEEKELIAKQKEQMLYDDEEGGGDDEAPVLPNDGDVARYDQWKSRISRLKEMSQQQREEMNKEKELLMEEEERLNANMLTQSESEDEELSHEDIEMTGHTNKTSDGGVLKHSQNEEGSELDVLTSFDSTPMNKLDEKFETEENFALFNGDGGIENGENDGARNMNQQLVREVKVGVSEEDEEDGEFEEAEEVEGGSGLGVEDFDE